LIFKIRPKYWIKFKNLNRSNSEFTRRSHHWHQHCNLLRHNMLFLMILWISCIFFIFLDLSAFIHIFLYFSGSELVRERKVKGWQSLLHCVTPNSEWKVSCLITNSPFIVINKGTDNLLSSKRFISFYLIKIMSIYTILHLLRWWCCCKFFFYASLFAGLDF
jgi:hypothetical protein